MVLQERTRFIGRRLFVASLLFVLWRERQEFWRSERRRSRPIRITVSAAISLKDSLDEIGPMFQIQRHPRTAAAARRLP